MVTWDTGKEEGGEGCHESDETTIIKKVNRVSNEINSCVKHQPPQSILWHAVAATQYTVTLIFVGPSERGRQFASPLVSSTRAQLRLQQLRIPLLACAPGTTTFAPPDLLALLGGASIWRGCAGLRDSDVKLLLKVLVSVTSAR